MKKFFAFVGFAFLIYFIAVDPSGFSDIINDIGTFIADVFESVASAVSDLFS